MKRILVVYGTTYGQTFKIAAYIADVIRTTTGWSADLIDVNTAGNIQFENYTAVIAGASVQASGFQKNFRKFIRTNSSPLNRMPGAFFSVCLGILQTRDSTVQEAERKIVSDLFDETNWRPGAWTIFAGALHYTRYGWFTRQIMKMIAKRAGGATDTSKDYEYTNWNDVRRFVSDFLFSLETTSVGGAAMTTAVRSPSTPHAPAFVSR